MKLGFVFSLPVLC